MSETFDCPSCGAALDYDGGEQTTLRCLYCNTSVIVPEALRTPKPAAFSAASLDLGALTGQAAQLKEIAQLARSGEKIEAIKRYRALTKVGLKEAKDAVEALTEGRPVVMQSASVQSFDFSSEESDPAQSFSFSGVQNVPVGVQMRPHAVRRRRPVLGCILVAVLLAVILVVVGALVGIRGALKGAGISEIPGVSVPVGFASRVMEFGEKGSGAGRFEDPRAIAVDEQNGTIYVAEYSGGRIQVFDGEGKFIQQWSADRKAYIQKMAVAPDGSLYVLSSGRLQRYDTTTGKALGEFKLEDPFDSTIEDMAFALDGSLLVVTARETLLRFNAQGEQTLNVPQVFTTVTDRSELSPHLAVDGQDHIYLLGAFNNTVLRYSPDGKYMDRFGGEGDGPGKFRALTADALAVDALGRVYVKSFDGIQVFQPDGTYVDVIRLTGKGVVSGMTFNRKNELFLATNAPLVLKYTVKE